MVVKYRNKNKATRRDSCGSGGQLYYSSEGALDPNKRAGIAYLQLGNQRLGRNSEAIRHVIQNKLAHSKLKNPPVPWFKVLDIPPANTNYYGINTGKTSW